VKTAIFIKTFPGDYAFLEYALRSIERFCSGFEEVVIVAPTKDCPRTKHRGRIHVIPDHLYGYLWQQLVKLRADEFTTADHILFHDSDCVFTQLVTPETFMRDGKIVWDYTPWPSTRSDERAAWQPVVDAWLGVPSAGSYMTRHPFVLPRWLLPKIREFCLNAHGKPLSQYVLDGYDPINMLTFSEFNCAGAYAHAYHRDQFVWRDTTKEPISPPVIHQEWSRGGLTPEVRSRLEEILSR